MIEARREQHRQTNTFSKGVRKPDPKRPGRKAGEGEFTRKAEPSFEAIDTFVIVPGPAQPNFSICGAHFATPAERHAFFDGIAERLKRKLGVD